MAARPGHAQTDGRFAVLDGWRGLGVPFASAYLSARRFELRGIAFGKRLARSLKMSEAI